MNSRLIASSALASLMAMGLAATAHAEDSGKEKCYGIAKPGANDCANLSGSHSCAGQAKNPMGPDEWNYVTKGTCAKLGGKSDEEAKAASRSERGSGRRTALAGVPRGRGRHRAAPAPLPGRAAECAGAGLRRGAFRELLCRRRGHAGRLAGRARALSRQLARRGAWAWARQPAWTRGIWTDSRDWPNASSRCGSPTTSVFLGLRRSPAWPVVHANDLLPLAHTAASLNIVVDNVQRVQERLGRALLVENVVGLFFLCDADIPEPEFLARLCERAGCALLLDVNNLMVNALNAAAAQPLSSCCAFVDALPRGIVGEIHLAGHCVTDTLVIDDHGSRVRPEVWALYAHTVRRLGAAPTLIEWDTDIPALEVLLDEARQARDWAHRATVPA